MLIHRKNNYGQNDDFLSFHNRSLFINTMLARGDLQKTTQERTVTTVLTPPETAKTALFWVSLPFPPNGSWGEMGNFSKCTAANLSFINYSAHNHFAAFPHQSSQLIFLLLLKTENYLLLNLQTDLPGVQKCGEAKNRTSYRALAKVWANRLLQAGRRFPFPAAV